MGSNLFLNHESVNYKGAVRRLDLLLAKKHLPYRPGVTRLSEFKFTVISASDVFSDHTVVFFGKGMASCNCESRIICIHMIAAEREKDALIVTGDSKIHSVGGDMVFFETDCRDPDRGIRPVLRCGCGAVATVGVRCKLCDHEFQENMKFDDTTLAKASADIFG